MKLVADWWETKNRLFVTSKELLQSWDMVTLKSISDSERPLGVVSGFSIFSLKCRLHGGIGLPFLH